MDSSCLADGDEVPQRPGPLVWHAEGLGDCLRVDLALARHEVLLIAPYVKEEALKHVLADLDPRIGVTLITGFNVEALLSRATDLAASRAVAARRGGVVRVLPGLHTKIYSRDWMSWWAGSANITSSGLQIGRDGNFEVLSHSMGGTATLSRIVTDLLHLSRPISLSALDRLDAVMTAFQTNIPVPSNLLDVVKAMWDGLESSSAACYMVQELPLVTTPEALVKALNGDRPVSPFVWHDAFLFALEPNDSEAVVRSKCAVGFRAIPIVKELDSFLTTPRRFGEITAWLHDRCEDRPTPYRSEIKDLAARVMNWCYQLYPGEYRRERPRHSELFGRADGEWSRFVT
jgi:hypothetical protein